MSPLGFDAVASRVESALGRGPGSIPHRGDRLPFFEPADEAALVALIELAASERWRLLPLGSGTHLDQAPWPSDMPPLDLAVGLTRLSGVVEHAAGDGTLTARAGTPLRELARVAAQHGQHVTPALGSGSGATLGGALAAGVSGWERLRYGPARHHLLGARMLLANGKIVHSGGRLVKNVTGYDLHRLFVGSQGSLGILLEATLRLFPLPKVRARVIVQGLEEEQAFYRAAALWDLHLNLEHLAVSDTDQRTGFVRLETQLAGSAPAVEAELERALEVLPGAVVELQPLEPESAFELTVPASRAAKAPWLELSALPSQAFPLWRALGHVLEAHALIAERRVDTALMRILVWGRPPSRSVLLELARQLAGHGAVLRGYGEPGGNLQLADPPAALPLRQRVEAALDPNDLFPKGRLHPAASNSR